MVHSPFGSVMRRRRRLVGPAASGGPGDGQLLERFAAHRDEAAFEALLGRHGPVAGRTVAARERTSRLRWRRPDVSVREGA